MTRLVPGETPLLLGSLGVACSWLAWILLGFDAAMLNGALVHARDVLQRAVGAVAGMRKGLGSRASEKVRLEEVSDMIDVVRLGLTAGLSFDAALGLYCEYRSGLLSTRLARALLEWQVGARTRSEALAAVAEDLGATSLASFSSAVSQALDMGAPLARTLEGQANECRAAHRAAVERRIERAPVKILIPTGTLILPALLLAIMGPLIAAGTAM